MRLFIGINIPDRIKRRIKQKAEEFMGVYNGQYAAGDSYHITLAYIGECDKNMHDLAIDAMKCCCEQFAPVSVDTAYADYFGKIDKAILHIAADSNGLLQPVSEMLRRELDTRELPYDRKPLVPHITLGRKVDLTESKGKLHVEKEEFMAMGLTLFHSCRIDDVLKYIPVHFEAFSGKESRKYDDRDTV